MTALIGMRCRSASAGSATGQPTTLPVDRSLYETSTSTVALSRQARAERGGRCDLDRHGTFLAIEKRRSRFTSGKTFVPKGGLEHGMRMMSVPQNMRAGPKASYMRHRWSE